MFLIYVHIPFCLRKCPYCDFFTLPYHSEMETRLITFIANQIKVYSKMFPITGRKVNTLYLGGGSPSCVSEKLLKEIVKILKDYFDLSSLEEFTIEVNPGDVSLAKVDCWKQIGINRVSLGVQSFDDRILSILERNHRRKDTLKALDLLVRFFRYVSIDLIFAVPGQTPEDWIKDLTFLKCEFPDVGHVSIYGLTIEQNTPFYYKYCDLDRSEVWREMYELADDFLSKIGLQWYEISNFSRPGQECKHNLGYWTGAEYIGLGPSGWSFIDGVRFSMDWAGKFIQDCLSEEKRQREQVVLSLRTRMGVKKEDLLPDQFEILSSIGREFGLVEDKGGRFVLTLRGRLFCDELATYLI